MTNLTTPTNSFTYPPEVHKGGGVAIKWINGLTREQFHQVVQDKQLPIALLGELVRHAPARYLRNLVHHKKCTTELRITILRRIYRSKPNELKIPDRMQTYNSVLKISDLSDKEIRITKSYIRELEQGNYSKDSAKSEKVLKKTSKKPKRKKRATRKESPPVIIRDSTVSEVVNFLRSARFGLIAELGENSKLLIDCQTQAGAMIADSQVEFQSLAIYSVNRIDMEDLLSFRIELNTELHRESKLGSNEEFIKSYKQINRGDVAKEFFTGINIQKEASEILYELLVKASSLSQIDFESKIVNLQSASHGFRKYLEKIPPQLNYGPVELTKGGMVTITFSASLNLKFTADSFIYWESEQDESFGFPIKFKVEFDRNSTLNNCTVTITNLLPGMRYMFGISALNGDRRIKLEPMEFKIPDLPKAEPSSGYVRGDYRDYGAPVPLGGGGERRFNQF